MSAAPVTPSSLGPPAQVAKVEPNAPQPAPPSAAIATDPPKYLGKKSKRSKKAKSKERPIDEDVQRDDRREGRIVERSREYDVPSDDGSGRRKRVTVIDRGERSERNGERVERVERDGDFFERGERFERSGDRFERNSDRSERSRDRVERRSDRSERNSDRSERNSDRSERNSDRFERNSGRRERDVERWEQPRDNSFFGLFRF